MVLTRTEVCVSDPMTGNYQTVKFPQGTAGTLMFTSHRRLKQMPPNICLWPGLMEDSVCFRSAAIHVHQVRLDGGRAGSHWIHFYLFL